MMRHAPPAGRGARRRRRQCTRVHQRTAGAEMVWRMCSKCRRCVITLPQGALGMASSVLLARMNATTPARECCPRLPQSSIIMPPEIGIHSKSASVECASPKAPACLMQRRWHRQRKPLLCVSASCGGRRGSHQGAKRAQVRARAPQAEQALPQQLVSGVAEARAKVA